MNLKELRGALREMLGDQTGPYLWPDAQLNRYLNNAVREACLRARLLKDDADSRPRLCNIGVDPSQPFIHIDPSILVVRSGSVTVPQTEKLWALSADSMDKLYPDWDTYTQPGTPRYMVMDLTQKTLRLHPKPAVATTLRLRVWRVPMKSEQMKDDDDCSIVHLPDDEELCHWAASEAFMVNDSELRSETKAAMHLQLFEQRFGSRPTLHDMARWADSPPRVRLAHMF